MPRSKFVEVEFIDLNEHIGKEARDKVTGFKGIITSFCQHLTGCDQYYLQPKCVKGEHKDGKWYDVNRIEVKSEEPIRLETRSEDKSKNTKGPCSIPPNKG